jgi:hypothetical protein
MEQREEKYKYRETSQDQLIQLDRPKPPVYTRIEKHRWKEHK